MFQDQCPICGASLQITSCWLDITGLYLRKDGFSLTDAVQICTEDEQIQCIDCKKMFDLSELLIEEE